jgi:hypothetical protein
MSTINSEQFTTIEIGNFPKELQVINFLSSKLEKPIK